ncbi:nucleotidyltransferase domain-containing protein [Anaerolentibacter hominis]|uniref:nucleotidyltransferase family protein n=1 Tax=Anaerolentibacter hominis TaxID=3079009 RepID=UPI0031B817F6
MGINMNETGINPDVIEEIKELARNYQVDRVILFGSRARGDYGRASDIDLAVQGGDFINFALDVDEKTSTLLMYDVIDLNSNVQEELLESIRKDGIVIYEKI